MQKSLKIPILILLLCAGAGYFVFYFTKTGDKNPAENNTIKKNPADELLSENSEALKKAENFNDMTVRNIDDADHVLGNLNAPVQIIIYDDFDNEFSADYYRTIRQVADNFGDKVAVAYRYFPMRSHQNSIIAALAAECAGEQKLFWEMAEKLFGAKSENKLDAENISIITKDIKLEQAKFDACLADKKYMDKIQASVTEADSINVTGAPTTFINKIPYPGAMPFDDFKDSSGLERKGLKSVIEAEIGKTEIKS